MSALVQYPQFDIEFAVLNDLARRLRTAGAKISVRKVGEKHRVTVLKEPSIATIEQIIVFTLGKTKDNIDTPNMPSDVALASNPAHKEETTDTPNPPELAVSPELEVPQELTVLQESVAPQELAVPSDLASSAELLSLPLEKLKALAKVHKITGLSKLKREKVAAKLEGLVTKEELA